MGPGSLNLRLARKFEVAQANKHAHSVVRSGGPTTLAEVLIGLIGQEVAPLTLAAAKVQPVYADDLDTWERKIEQQVADDVSIPETDRLAIVRARKGQGLFKERVGKIESKCRITGVENPVHLVASHCKPWRDATNEERLNGENGLLLTPSIDHLFDRGFIGFENNGALIISPVAHRPSLERMGIETTKAINVGVFTSGQKQFLDFHRNSVLLQSIRS
jgi:putative restriction endonuclease